MPTADLASASRALIETLPVAVSVFNRSRRLEVYNRAFAELWRLEPDWLDARPGLDAFLEKLRADRRLPEQSDFRAFRESWLGRFDKLEDPLVESLYLPDGTALQVITSPYLEGGLVIAFEDLSARLAAERAYNESVAVQRVTLDHLDDGIAVFGSDGRHKFHNAAFAELWQLASSDLAGDSHIADILRRIGHLFPDIGDWPARVEALVPRYLGRATGQEQWRRSDGRIVETCHIPLPDGAVLLRFTDITHRVQNETELQARVDTVEDALRVNSQSLAHLSHELRVPLNTISGFAQLLAGPYFGELNRRQQEYGDGIVAAAQKLSSLLTDIVDIANIEAGFASIDADSLDLHNLAVGVLPLIEPRARRKKLDLAIECPTDIGWILADEKRLRQVLVHLLNNAITFTGAGGRITLKMARHKEEVAISVADTGIGIPTAERERIFQGFARGETAGDDPPGAGLGLTLIKSVIALHGGRIDLKSRPGRGTTVICYLPAG